MYLLDTNVCIYTIRRRPALVLERLSQHEHEGIALSVITAFELEVGARRAAGTRYEAAVEAFLRQFTVLPLDHDARVAYGSLCCDLERRGAVIGAHDMLIAAHALRLDATLVTSNEREFKRVAGLKVENWTR